MGSSSPIVIGIVVLFLLILIFMAVKIVNEYERGEEVTVTKVEGLKLRVTKKA